MGPIEQAKDALTTARNYFRDYDLVDDEECKICSRIIKGGLHAEFCPVPKIDNALRQLGEFQQTVAA